MTEKMRRGRWTLIGVPFIQNRSRYVLCRCDCGKERAVNLSMIKTGRSKSCGCLRHELATKHGASSTPEYKAWRAAVRRTQDPCNVNFADYGGRGISMAKEYIEDFGTFFQDVGSRPSPKHSIDRIDNNKGYVPGNIRWATASIQNRNQRRVKLTDDDVARIRSLRGRVKTCAIARQFGVSHQAVSDILNGRRWAKDEGAALLRAMAEGEE